MQFILVPFEHGPATCGTGEGLFEPGTGSASNFLASPKLERTLKSPRLAGRSIAGL